MPSVQAVLSYVGSGAALWMLEFGNIESSFFAGSFLFLTPSLEGREL